MAGWGELDGDGGGSGGTAGRRLKTTLTCGPHMSAAERRGRPAAARLGPAWAARLRAAARDGPTA
jgi:hypothetical protein